MSVVQGAILFVFLVFVEVIKHDWVRPVDILSLDGICLALVRAQFDSVDHVRLCSSLLARFEDEVLLGPLLMGHVDHFFRVLIVIQED